MAERVYNTRRRISILPQPIFLTQSREDDDNEDDPEDDQEDRDLELDDLDGLNKSSDKEVKDNEEKQEEDNSPHNPSVRYPADPYHVVQLGGAGQVPERRLDGRSSTISWSLTDDQLLGKQMGPRHSDLASVSRQEFPDLTRSQMFDDGEGEDGNSDFTYPTCPSTTAATPTDHAPRTGHASQPPRPLPEENLLRKRSLTKQSTMPELAEATAESQPSAGLQPLNRPPRSPSPGSGLSPTRAGERGGAGVAQASPTTVAAAASNSAFPSLPDDKLKNLGLYRQKGDPLDLGAELSDQEIEEKFACLSLAFKTDKLTLEKRIDLHERARDIAEQNVNKEIAGLKEAMKTLSPFCTDAQSRDLYSQVQHHVEVLEQSTSRVSSRAEVHGAVQQELRMSKAIDVMVNHVENLKRMYDKEHQELEETKKLLHENKGQDGDGMQKRAYSLATGSGLKRTSISSRKTSRERCSSTEKAEQPGSFGSGV